MAGRKRNSAENIVRKLRRADELAAEGKTGEEIAAELQVSRATLYKWRRTYGGMDTDAAKELKELREQNARLKRLLAWPNSRRMPCGGARENSEPSCYAPRRLQLAQTPADPDAEMKAWLRAYATKHPLHGFQACLGGAAPRRAP